MSINEGNRRRPTPLYGLIILGLAAILLEFSISWNGLQTDSSRGADQGNCMYQGFQDEQCLGTIFMKEPASIQQILERLGIPQRTNLNGSQEKIPCNRSLRLGEDLKVTAIEKIKGTHIISAGKRIDVNVADLEDLEAVPGIGSRLAERIMALRNERGRFSDIEELRKIPGIGRKKLEGLSSYIEAGPSGIFSNRLQHIQTSGSLFEPSATIQK